MSVDYKLRALWAQIGNSKGRSGVAAPTRSQRKKENRRAKAARKAAPTAQPIRRPQAK